MRLRQSKIENNQLGFASIVIAIVLILILSLITVGFAQLMRHEQRSALDKQLNSQAYYAAETGINDAESAISYGYDIPKTVCGTNGVVPAQPGSNKILNNRVGGAGSGVSYPCLLINPTPPTVKYANVSISSPTIFEMTGYDPATNTPTNVNTIEISWQSVNADRATALFNNKCSPTGGRLFTPAIDSSVNIGNTGMVQAEVVPLPTSSSLDRNTFIDNAYVAFLCPSTNTSSSTITNYAVNVNSINTNSGVIVDGDCSINPSGTNLLFCNAQITGLNLRLTKTFFVELQSIYSPTQVVVTAYNNGPGTSISQANQLNISGAQVLIDSTGKAQDILRRIQVRIPLHNSYDIPSGSSGNICKQLQISPIAGQSSNACYP